MKAKIKTIIMKTRRSASQIELLFSISNLERSECQIEEELRRELLRERDLLK